MLVKSIENARNIDIPARVTRGNGSVRVGMSPGASFLLAGQFPPTIWNFDSFCIHFELRFVDYIVFYIVLVNMNNIPRHRPGTLPNVQ